MKISVGPIILLILWDFQDKVYQIFLEIIFENFEIFIKLRIYLEEF